MTVFQEKNFCQGGEFFFVFLQKNYSFFSFSSTFNTALVQTVSLDGCADDAQICKFNNKKNSPNNRTLILRYHVDLIANQITDQIRLEISIKSRYNHIPPNDDDDYDRLAIFDNLCQTNQDICPTNFNVLYHFCYGFRLDNVTLLVIILINHLDLTLN